MNQQVKPACTARNRIFAIRIGPVLLYETLTSNPSKSLRFYKRLDRKDRPSDVFVSELEMRRKVVQKKREAYIGPMR